MYMSTYIAGLDFQVRVIIRIVCWHFFLSLLGHLGQLLSLLCTLVDRQLRHASLHCNHLRAAKQGKADSGRGSVRMGTVVNAVLSHHECMLK